MIWCTTCVGRPSVACVLSQQHKSICVSVMQFHHTTVASAASQALRPSKGIQSCKALCGHAEYCLCDVTNVADVASKTAWHMWACQIARPSLCGHAKYCLCGFTCVAWVDSQAVRLYVRMPFVVLLVWFTGVACVASPGARPCVSMPG